MDQAAAVNILQYCLDTLKSGYAIAGYKLSSPAYEEAHSEECPLDGKPVNETETLQ